MRGVGVPQEVMRLRRDTCGAAGCSPAPAEVRVGA